MSYFNKNSAQKQRPSQQQGMQQQQKKPLPQNNNKQFQQRDQMQQQQQEPEGKTLQFAEDEVVFIENVLVKLEDLIPNDQGENQEIMEMIVTAEQIISARLDESAGFIGDSA